MTINNYLSKVMDAIPLIILFSLMTYPLFSFLYDKHVKEPKEFKKAFEQFNHERFNPIDEDLFKKIYEFSNNLGILLITGGIGTGNQRDGDELVTNLDRDHTQRMLEHLDFKTHSGFVIGTLGYKFKNPDNLKTFMETLSKIQPVGTRVIPINGTWFISYKEASGKYKFSIDKNMMRGIQNG